jgi:hypothetical protein
MRIKANREARRLAEIERRRKEALEEEQAERRRDNAKLIHVLERQAGAWIRACMLRRYLRALRRTLGSERLEGDLQGKSVDFLDWAQRYIDQIDPLSSVPHHPDLLDDRSSYYQGDDKLRRELARLSGHDWQDAWKVAVKETAEDEGIEEDEFEQFEDDED